MCDEECRKRFKAIELNINSMANDLKWMRWLIRSAIVIGAAAFGVDVTGMI
jgi:hypothetical protein